MKKESVLTPSLFERINFQTKSFLFTLLPIYSVQDRQKRFFPLGACFKSKLGSSFQVKKYTDLGVVVEDLVGNSCTIYWAASHYHLKLVKFKWIRASAPTHALHNIAHDFRVNLT